MAGSMLELMRNQSNDSSSQVRTAQEEMNTQRLLDEFSPASVRLKTERGSGSAFFVDSDGHVVTASHVVLNRKEIFATTTNGKTYRARVENLDDTHDLAELKLEGFKPGELKHISPMESDGQAVDSPVYAIGYPGKFLTPQIDKGNLEERSQMYSIVDKDKVAVKYAQATEEERKDWMTALERQMLKTDVSLAPGNSGSMLINEKGSLLGVADLAGTGVAYFTPVEDVRNLLNTNTGRFQFSYIHQREPLSNGFLSNAPLALGTVGVSAVGYGLALRTPSLSAIAPQALTVGAGLYAASHLGTDYSRFKESTYGRDILKYGLSTALDAGIIATSALSFVPAARPVAYFATGAEVAARLATDFIPNRLVLDKMTQNDGTNREPFDWRNVDLP